MTSTRSSPARPPENWLSLEQRVQRALAQVDGVVRSAADHRGAHVTVVFDPARTSAQAVQARIGQAGYEVAS